MKQEIKEEIWKDIPSYEGLYQVSDQGRVKSLERITVRSNNVQYSIRERILKPALSVVGYLYVNLCKEGVKTRTVHQLVVEAFRDHIPCGYEQVVNHIDFDKKNNRLSNLQIVTPRQNSNKKHIKSTSKHTGVSLNTKLKKWQSCIWYNNESIYLGLFNCEEEAGQAYQKALKNILDGKVIGTQTRIPSSKFKGVGWSNKANKWQAFIYIPHTQKTMYLGLFHCEIEASNAYQTKLKEILNETKI